MSEVPHPQKAVLLLPNGRKCYHVKHPQDPPGKPKVRRRQGWGQRSRRTQSSLQSPGVEAGVQVASDLEVGRPYVRSDPVVILDVGGQKFTALKSTLYRFPTTRYGGISAL